jgi:twinkle protein
VSHLRKGEKPFEEGHLPSIDDIKGSGSIKQISFDIIAFARNMIAETEQMRNTIKLRVLKSRFTGMTGDCGSTRYDSDTGRLMQTTFVDFE